MTSADAATPEIEYLAAVQAAVSRAYPAPPGPAKVKAARPARADRPHKVGARVTYHGRVKAHRGEVLEVIESRTVAGHSSVRLRLGERETWVSSRSVAPVK